MAGAAPSSPDLLDSWKAIAEYLHRDVRTLQRWEQSRGLPVHRLPGTGKPGVYAFQSELDRWLATAPGEDRSSIAVLPFVSLSTAPEGQFFCDGLADGIITALAQAPGLRVTARTSSFAFRGQDVDVRKVGAQLNAAAVLEGSVQWAGDRIRVSAQLIDAATGYHSWSQMYERPSADVFAIQDDITAAIMRELKLQLRQPGRPARNLGAYHSWVRGRHEELGLTPTCLDKSRDAYIRALSAEPEFAPAWLGLAENEWNRAFFGIARPCDAMLRPREYAYRALDYDPQMGEAYAILASVQAAHDFNWASAERTFHTALRYSPASVAVHRAHALFLLEPLGRLDEALEELEYCCDQDPLQPLSHAWLGQLHFFRREYEAARQSLEAALHLDDSCWWARATLAATHALQGESEKAITLAREVCEQSGSSLFAGPLGAMLGLLGYREEADKALRALEQTDPGTYRPPIVMAWCHMGQRDPGRVFEWLSRAVDERDPQILHLPVKPIYDNLRGDPRFRTLLERMRLPSAGLKPAWSRGPESGDEVSPAAVAGRGL